MTEDGSAHSETQSSAGAENEPIISDGSIIDCITGDKPLKDTPKEQVRQFIAHALKNQYHIDYEDMQADFVVGSGKSRRVVDIAIFHPGRDHSVGNLSRAVICRPMPTVGRNSTRLRDPHEAEKDLSILSEIMEQVETCQYGLWTNKLDIFYRPWPNSPLLMLTRIGSRRYRVLTF